MRASVPLSPARPRRRAASGFSFVEVLFAVMILGVGFIMVAAVFPVAIQQAQNASDESVSAAVAWNALTLIQEKFSSAELPGAGAPENLEQNTPFDEDYYPGVLRSFRDPQAGRDLPTLLKGQPSGPGRLKPGVVLGDVVKDDWKALDPKNQITFAQPRDFLWNRIKGDSVVVDDHRFAWVAFYSRHIIEAASDEPAPYAQVIIVVARAREASAYGGRDVNAAGAVLANLQPRPVQFDLTSDGDGPKVDQTVTFFKGEKDAVVEGAYLIVAHDKLRAPKTSDTVPAPQGALNCHVFRVGNRVAGDTWQLSPEADFAPQTVFGADVRGLSGAEGYVVGRTSTAGRYGGVAQDVAVYSMIIPVF
jgi:type II secretory pathway pseudopilin PulG